MNSPDAMWKNAKLHLLISYNLTLYDNKALKSHVIRITLNGYFLWEREPI